MYQAFATKVCNNRPLQRGMKQKGEGTMTLRSLSTIILVLKQVLGSSLGSICGLKQGFKISFRVFFCNLKQAPSQTVSSVAATGAVFAAPAQAPRVCLDAHG